MNGNDLYFPIRSDDLTGGAFRSFGTHLSNAKSAVNGLSKEFDEAGRILTKFGALGSGVSAALTLAFSDSVTLYDQQARAEAKVSTAIETTGAVAGFTAKQLFKQASALQELTRIGDEVILDDLSAQLLTFKQISGQVFLDAQVAALDLATTLDGDLQGAAIMLGKALNDPVAGVSALSEAGVTFTETQKEVIENLTTTGKIADAQRLILDEIASAYGGQARAAALAGAGIRAQWENTWGDVKEVVGKNVLDMQATILPSLQKMAGGFTELEPATQKVVVSLGALAVAIPPLTLSIGALMAVTTPFIGTLTLGAAAIAAITAGVILFSGAKGEAEIAVEDLTEALGQELVQIDLLSQSMDQNATISEDLARDKLEEARARYENVKAIHDERRALELEANNRVGVGAMSMPEHEAAAYDRIIRGENPGNVPDYIKEHRGAKGHGYDIFDPRGQAISEGRVDLNRGTVADPIYSPEMGEDLESATDNIERLENALDNANNGMVKIERSTRRTVDAGNSLNDSLGKTSEVSDRIASAAKDSLGSIEDAASKASSEARDALSKIDASAKATSDELERLAGNEVWGMIKEELRDITQDGKDWRDSWVDITQSIKDRLYDLAMDQVWDMIASSVAGAFGGGSSQATQGAGTQETGGIFSSIGSVVGGLFGGGSSSGGGGGFLGFNEGGSFTVRGRAGIDRNLATVRLSEGEEVHVTRRGSEGAQITQYITIATPNPSSFHASKTQVATTLRRAVAGANRGG